ncbi:MAG TPA: Trp biosynthesis-associated membrane protein [Mycobacteriales bacterium]|nr:Trp biosynthesis-associated membrane protein [Mycobacteriales bacterium]HVX69254.1 Trp biosynthesis-associated membrane protein [Mycobacteriales bacterium]
MRGLLGSLVGLVVGGVLVLVASGRVWSSTTVNLPGAPASPVSVTGHAIEPSLPALAIALLAMAAAVIAARGRMRRAIGVLITVVGGAAVAVALAGRAAVSSALTSHEIGGLGVPAHGTANGWWVVAAVGAVDAALAGLAVTFGSGTWAAMGQKYEAPQSTAPVTAGADSAVGTWDALDRGEDPTE